MIGITNSHDNFYDKIVKKKSDFPKKWGIDLFYSNAYRKFPPSDMVRVI